MVTNMKFQNTYSDIISVDFDRNFNLNELVIDSTNQF